MENQAVQENTQLQQDLIISAEQLLEHWQGHRNLTRKMIEVFPDDKLFSYSVGGMRPFAELAMEMIDMVGSITGVVTRKWGKLEELSHASGEIPKTKSELLSLWDKATDALNENWAKIPKGRFQEMDVAFGLYEGPIYSIVFYWIDNEIHHRGQGYVYLRSLGIAPPPFWERM